MSLCGWLSSWDVEVWCGIQSCVTLGQSLVEEQSWGITKPSQVGGQGGEQMNYLQRA